jgi:hypothetical protein
MIEWVKFESGECETLDEVPKGARIEAIDDKFCIGICEVCESPILEDSEGYLYSSDGVYTCGKCSIGYTED